VWARARISGRGVDQWKWNANGLDDGEWNQRAPCLCFASQLFRSGFFQAAPGLFVNVCAHVCICLSLGN
jgi:hypothetical protein